MASRTTQRRRKGAKQMFNEIIDTIIQTAERGRQSSLRFPGARREQMEEYERLGEEARRERGEEVSIRETIPTRTEKQPIVRRNMTRQGLDLALNLAGALGAISHGEDFDQRIGNWIEQRRTRGV